MTRASVLGSSNHCRTIGVSSGSSLKTLEQTGQGARLQVAGTYTVTFAWSNCIDGYSDDLRVRIYTGAITQRGAAAEVRFTHPQFVRNSADRGNVLHGQVDAATLLLSADGGSYYAYYGPAFSPFLIEVIADNSRLVTIGAMTLTSTATGFAGPVSGSIVHYGPLYPRDRYLGMCRSGQVEFKRQ